MKHLKFLAAVCCMAAVFAACEKNDPSDNTNNNGTNTDQYFYVTVVSNDETRGTVKGEGNYPAGAKINIMATPNTGSYFQQWNDGNTDNPRTITVTGDATYTAIFDYCISGTANGHDYVDLGLPSGTKWATCNVGATKPEEYGDYYAWGETTTKSSYSYDNYKWSNDGFDTFTKYCTSSDYGTVDNKTVLELADDAARANWGGAWRMPTDAEWTELRENCTWTWITKNGVNGYEVKSEANGNSIFLPAAGYRYNGDLYGAGYGGYYWSSSLYTDAPYSAWLVYFGSDDVLGGNFDRYYGQSVRPVL